MPHPLHLEVGKVLSQSIREKAILVLDNACGGTQHIPLFTSNHRARETQLCKVDLLLLKDNKVKVIVEIEESGFNPTKICGKFLTSTLATHYIHGRVPTERQYDNNVLFVQILDSSKFSKKGSSKEKQCKLIEKKIISMLPKIDSKISEYRLITVNGPQDRKKLSEVTQFISNFV